MLESLQLYLAYVGTAIALLIVSTAIYVLITPYREFTLIRQGNRTAAISLGGTLIGFGLVLASTAAHSTGLRDMALWAAVALTFQIAVFFITSQVLLRGFRAGLEADRDSYGIALAAFSITVGLINAGAVTY